MSKCCWCKVTVKEGTLSLASSPLLLEYLRKAVNLHEGPPAGFFVLPTDKLCIACTTIFKNRMEKRKIKFELSKYSDRQPLVVMSTPPEDLSATTHGSTSTADTASSSNRVWGDLPPLNVTVVPPVQPPRQLFPNSVPYTGPTLHYPFGYGSFPFPNSQQQIRGPYTSGQPLFPHPSHPVPQSGRDGFGLASSFPNSQQLIEGPRPTSQPIRGPYVPEQPLLPQSSHPVPQSDQGGLYIAFPFTYTLHTYYTNTSTHLNLTNTQLALNINVYETNCLFISTPQVCVLNGDHPGPVQCVQFNPKYMMMATACTNMVKDYSSHYIYIISIFNHSFHCQ